MSRWDGGANTEEIVATTGYARSYVESVVGRFSISGTVLNSFDKMVIAGSAALLAAIKLHHPEMVRR